MLQIRLWQVPFYFAIIAAHEREELLFFICTVLRFCYAAYCIVLINIRTQKKGADYVADYSITTRYIPSSKELQRELKRVRRRSISWMRMGRIGFLLLTAASVVILIISLWFPILRIYGESMTPTLNNGEMIIFQKTSDFESGDVISFYYNNKILVKRVIALPGQWVDFDEDGTVYVDQIPLQEPYLKEKALGECNIELPYQVPDGNIFVMGDHRQVSVDSRSRTVGCINRKNVVGKILFRIWPIRRPGAAE